MDSSQKAELILYNIGAMIRFDKGPQADAVAIANGRILCLGKYTSTRAMSRPSTRLIDCQGYTLAPGFIDSHCHLLSLAASALSVDCTPSKASSISDIQAALKAKAQSTTPRAWIRGYGYDEFYLKEKRHPNRWDVDQAVHNQPVKLNHRSGHACVLNSTALAALGITAQSEEPAGGVIERDLTTGEPTGLLLEMESHLENLIPSLTYAELAKGVRIINRRLLSYGITSVQDATFTNSFSRWSLFSELKASGILTPRTTVMPGVGFLDEFVQHGLTFGFGTGRLNIGHAKMMLTRTTGHVYPHEDELRNMALKARNAGFPLAIHAVEAEAVETAIRVIKSLRTHASGQNFRHRIEHCSECPPDSIARLREAKAIVVTQPGFLYYNGRRYLSEVAQNLQPHLYPIASMKKAGIVVAAGSDAPVAPENPIDGIYSAVTRRASTGQFISMQQGVSPIDAMRTYTLDGAYAASQENYKGSIEEGKLADLILMTGNLLRTAHEELGKLKVALTILNGEVVWDG